MKESGAAMGERRRPWSDEEVRKLRIVAGQMPVMTIAKWLNRTRGQVAAKAAEEKLSLAYRNAKYANTQR